MNHEASQPINPDLQAEAAARPIDQAALLLDAAEAGLATPEQLALLSETADHITSDEMVSGGFTIQGTDEWIPGKRSTLYRFNAEDEKGNKHVESIDENTGKRLLDFKASYTQPAEAAPATSPAVPATETVAPALTTPARKPRRRATRPQGAPTPSVGEQVDSIFTDPADTAAQTPAATHASTRSTPKSRQTSGAPTSKAKGGNVTHKRDEIADLVSLDANGRAHYTSGVNVATGKSLKGKFMTKHELDMIADPEIQDLIRDGLATRNEPGTAPEAEGRHRSRTPEEASAELARLLAEYDHPLAYSPQMQNALLPNNAPIPINAQAVSQRAQGVMGKLRSFRARFNTATVMGFDRVANYFTDPEDHKGRKRGVVAVAGVLALAGAFYMAKNHGHVVTGTGSRNAGGTPPVAPKGGGAGAGIGTGDLPPAPKPHTVALKAGSNPWELSREHLQATGVANPTDGQIQAYDNQILSANHWTPEMARHLAVGTEVIEP